MKCTKENLNLYVVTDRKWLKDSGKTLANQVEESIKGGASFVQLREKCLSEEEFISEAKDVQKVCKKYNIPFVINDNVNIARIINADGVHVGQNDMSVDNVKMMLGDNAIVGVSVQTVEQAVLAQKGGADYLGVGAVFTTNSKSDADYVTIDTLKKITKSVTIPVIAIGGINYSNISELNNTGICGVAVISAVFAEKDIESATRSLKNKTMELLRQ